MPRIKLRFVKWVAAGLFVVWIGIALLWTFSAGAMPEPWGRTDPSVHKFVEGLTVIPALVVHGLATRASRTAFPEGNLQFSRMGLCENVGYELAVNELAHGGQPGETGRSPKVVPASDLEIRTQGDRVYFGWLAKTNGSAPRAAAFEAHLEPYKVWGGAAISQEQWNSAEPVAPQVVRSETGAGERFFTFRGKRYQPSGARWFHDPPTGVLSPDGKRLAFVTFDGPIRPSGLYSLDFTRSWWYVHLDAFGVAYGQVLLHQLSAFTRSSQAPRDPILIWGANRLLLSGTRDQDFVVGVCTTTESPEPRTLDYAHEEISLPSAAMNARVSVRPMDDDHNGRLDAIELIATFNAPQQGVYLFSANVSRSVPTPGVPNDASPWLNRTLSAGPQTLRLVLAGASLANVHGQGDFILDRIHIAGPGGAEAMSNESVALPGLPEPETVPFELTGESSLTGPAEDLGITGSLKYISPGGVCRWSGTVVQEPRTVRFSGEQFTQPGSNSLSFSVSAKELKPFDRRRAFQIRLTDLRCGGRALRPRRGEEYLAAFDELRF